MSTAHLTRKVCPNCGVDKLREEYYIRGNGHIHNLCKPCHLEYNRKTYAKNRDVRKARSKNWRANNPERYKEQMREWRENNKQRKQELEHRRRARKQKNGVYLITDKDMRYLSGPCAYCGSTENITMDHVIPISRGGTHGIGNLVPACLSCNNSKLDKTFAEWKYGKSRPYRAA